MEIKISPTNPIIRCHVSGTRTLQEGVDVTVGDCSRFTVPREFSCDGSSIPRVFWRLVGSPTTGPNLLAGIVHDYLYRFRVYDRNTCDRIFYTVLIHLGKPRWAARLMYWAVRLVGGRFY